MSRRSSAALRSLTLLPSTRMSPSVMSIMRLTIRIAVVFPQPEGPTSTQISPAGTVSDSSSTAGRDCPEYRFVARRNSSVAAGVAAVTGRRLAGAAILPARAYAPASRARGPREACMSAEDRRSSSSLRSWRRRLTSSSSTARSPAPRESRALRLASSASGARRSRATGPSARQRPYRDRATRTPSILAASIHAMVAREVDGSGYRTASARRSSMSLPFYARGVRLGELPGWAMELIEGERIARLAFVDDHDRPRVLPVTYAIAEGAVWSAIDDKPKGAGEPARVRYLRRRPEAALCVDRYDDDWSRLAWVQLLGTVEVLSIERGGPGLEALVE